jgi:hypothetical protein
MCKWLINRSPLQLQLVERSQLVSLKPIIAMQQVNMLLMVEYDHEQCAHIFQKKIKATSKVIKDKVISQKLIHHTWRNAKWAMWWTCQSRNKCLSIQNKIHVQAKKGRKDDNVEGISTSKANDYLCVMHDVWWHVKFGLAKYKRLQPRQGTRGHYLWDVSIDDWIITCG